MCVAPGDFPRRTLARRLPCSWHSCTPRELGPSVRRVRARLHRGADYGAAGGHGSDFARPAPGRKRGKCGASRSGRLWINVAASLVCALVLVGVFALLHGTGAATAAIYGPTLVLLAATTSLEIAAIAGQRPVRAAASRLAGNVCVLGLTIGLQIHDARGGRGCIPRWRDRQARLHRDCDAPARTGDSGTAARRRPLLRRGAPFYGSAIAAFLYQRVDVLMLGALTGVAAAGEYVAAYRILDGILLLPAAVVAVFLPSWAERRGANGAAGRGAGMVVVLLICIGVLAGAELVLARGVPRRSAVRRRVRLVCPDSRRPRTRGADLLRGHCARLDRLRPGYEKRVAALGIVALFTNVWINVVLIRVFGGVGAAVATVVTEAVICAGYAFTLGIHRREHRARALDVLATAGAYAGALFALGMLCAVTGVHWALACIAVAGLGTVLAGACLSP